MEKRHKENAIFQEKTIWQSWMDSSDYYGNFSYTTVDVTRVPHLNIFVPLIHKQSQESLHKMN